MYSYACFHVLISSGWFRINMEIDFQPTFCNFLLVNLIIINIDIETLIHIQIFTYRHKYLPQTII
jgi:hypothetical protein